MTDEQLTEIFFPYYNREIERIRKENIKFACYTDLTTTMSILKNQEIWLRNVMLMNDYFEVKQGLELLKYYLIEKNYKDKLIKILTAIGNDKSYWENVLKEFLKDNEPAYFLHTYIACFTEHQVCEYDGRLSMFRAYGRGNGSVLIFNANSKLNLQIDVSKVLYCDKEDFKAYLDEFIISLEKNICKLKYEKIEIVGNLLKQAILFAILSIKHPGFKEEKEWRIIYCDKIMKNPEYNKIYKPALEVINGVPQKIYKLNLNNIMIANLLDEVIIQGTPDSVAAKLALDYYLREFRVKNDYIKISSIPYRNW